MGVDVILSSNVGGSTRYSTTSGGMMVKIRPNTEMKISGIYASVVSVNSQPMAPRVYAASPTLTLIATGPSKLGTTVAGGSATYFSLDAPIILEAGKTYYIGVAGNQVDGFGKGIGAETIKDVYFYNDGTYLPGSVNTIYGASIGVGLERVVNTNPILNLISPFSNMLGVDGNCEDLSKWPLINGGAINVFALDPTHKTSGLNSIKISSAGTTMFKSRSITVTQGKYYVALMDIRSNDGIAQGRLAIRNSAGLYPHNGQWVTATTFARSYVKFVGAADLTALGIYVSQNGSTSFLNFDSVRLYEVTKAIYDKIDVDPEYTGDKLAQKFPFTDPTNNQTLVEGNTYVIAGTATEADAGNVVTVKYKIDDGSTYNITASVSDGTTPINFNKTLTYLNNRLYDGQNPITPILDDNVTHKLTVWAEDDQGGKSPEVTRNFTVLYNQPPQISGSDQDLGSIAAPPSIPYSVTDIEGYAFTITEAIDGTTIRSFPGVDGQQETLAIPADIWLTLQPDVTHQLTITATDQYNASSKRTYTFKRTVDGIELETVILPADAKPTRTILSLNGQFPAGTNVNVLVCNNAHDAAPTWEDMTSSVLNNRPYLFTNETSTSGQWGIKFKISIMPGA